MKILMVTPSGTYSDEGASYKRISYPMGLMSLSSAVKKIRINEADGWETAEEDHPDRETMLIDSAAEGFGLPDGSTDRLIERDNRRLRIFGLSDDELARKAEAFGPEVIFITAQFTKNYEDFLHSCETLRERFPQAFIVAGGIAATHAEQIPTQYGRELSDEELDARRDNGLAAFRHGVDIVVRNEGEITAVRLLDQIEEILNNPEMNAEAQNELLAKVPNLIFRPRGSRSTDDLTRTEIKHEIASVADFDRLPFPDLEMDGLNYRNYDRTRFHGGVAKSDRWIELFTSRGCSNDCTFCGSRRLFGCFRGLSDGRIRELLAYYKDHGFDEISIEDDSIMDDPARSVRIFYMINEEGFNNFTCIGGVEFKHLLFKPKEEGQQYYLDRSRLVRNEKGELEVSILTKEQYDLLPENIDYSRPDQPTKATCTPMVDGRKIIDSMADNGCYRIYLAMESANPQTLEAIGKVMRFPEGFERTKEEAGKLLEEQGIEAHGGIMIGNPETEGIDEMMEDVRFAHKMMKQGLSRIAFFPYIMLPATIMSEINNPVRRFGRIRREYGYSAYSFDTTNMDSLKHRWTAEELITIVHWANNVLDSGKSTNWTNAEKGNIISEEKLEEQIKIMSDPEVIYQMTALRLLKEGGTSPNAEGKTLLDYYHEAIKAVRDTLPEYVYELKQGTQISDEAREAIINKHEEQLARTIAKENGLAEIEADRRIAYAKDEMQLAMRAPEIHVRPNDGVLMRENFAVSGLELPRTELPPKKEEDLELVGRESNIGREGRPLA